MLLAGAGGLVALLIVLVALNSGSGPAEPAAAPPTNNLPVAAVGDDLVGKAPDGLTQLDDDAATDLLRKADQDAGGSIVEAWQWDDNNGRNLVVTSSAKDGDRRTLRVIHVAELETDDPRTLRVMRDPDLPTRCDGAGTAGFTPESLIVHDLDSDDQAEVITGWTSQCGDADSSASIKLALITGGDKYIIRGEGAIGRADADQAVPEPKTSRWPDEYLEAVNAQYRKLYG